LFFIKSANTWKSIAFIAGFFLYAGGAVMWMVILRLLPLSFAFPIAAGSLVIGTMLTGVLFLKEAVTISQSFGAVLIIAGIFLIARAR
jgi:multidrug transporter EmrE-like cation transporter